MNAQLERIKKTLETYTKGYSLRILERPIEKIRDFSIYESDILVECGGGSPWRYLWEDPVSYITIWFHKYIRKGEFDGLVRALYKTDRVVAAVHTHVYRWYRINLMIERKEAWEEP